MNDGTQQRSEFFSASSACRVCGQSAIEELTGFSQFRRVTSDCRPWPAGGRLAVCLVCGCLQKPEDARLTHELAAIYAGYEIYHQSGGAEQVIFSLSGQAASRSSRLVKALRSEIYLPPKGRLLDIGCGNGATLKAFGAAMPGWSLVGTELDDRHRGQIESMRGVEGFFTCPVSDVPGHFDLITMIHVLEHVPQPTTMLKMAWTKLLPGGHLVIDVPDYTCNPFDLLIADHCTHFTVNSAVRLIRIALGTDATVARDWLPKELVLVARATAVFTPPMPDDQDVESTRESVAKSLHWLWRLAETARSIRRSSGLGVFGTSIAGTWLFAELGGKVDFFVDEDPNRAGKTFLGLPVFHPSQVPDGTQVYLALPPPMARSIYSRIGREGIVYHFPPQP
jgi:trans-aconitate methyltransferase